MNCMKIRHFSERIETELTIIVFQHKLIQNDLSQEYWEILMSETMIGWMFIVGTFVDRGTVQRRS